MDILEYKGYQGTAELDMERRVCRGKLLFITDLVTYEAKTPAQLDREFKSAVDDYIETCRALNRQPKRPFRGQFNVRIRPELHQAAALRAARDGVTLNEVAGRAFELYLDGRAGGYVAQQSDEGEALVEGSHDAQAVGTVVYANVH